MRRLIFSILTGFAGIAAWGQTPVAAHPTAANDTLTEDSTYALQEVVVRTSPVKRKADRFILSVPPAQNKDGVELLQQAPEYGCPTSGFPLMVLPARRCM